MSSIKILSDLSVYNSITAVSAVNAGDLIVQNSIQNPHFSNLQSSSGNWNDTLSIVSSLSDSWNQTYSAVSLTSGNWNQGYSYIVSSSSTWDNTYSTVRDNSGNWNTAYQYAIAYSSVSANPVVDTLAINSPFVVGDSKLYVVGNVTVVGNISANGTMTFTNTNFATTSALSVVNTGTGPAVVVNQMGDQAIVAFYDGETVGVPAFFVDGSNARPGNVGIGTDKPNAKLTVVGNISASGMITASGLNAPHTQAANTITDFYTAALSATAEQMVIYSLLFGG